MKVLKIILIVVLILVGTFVIINAFLPANYSVERSTTVQAPKELVFKQVVDFKNWEQWSPWLAMDSTMTFNYGEQTKGAGATYSWTGENSGNGKQEMTAVSDMDTIKTHIVFEGMGESDGLWVFTENEDGTTHVSWSFSGENSFF